MKIEKIADSRTMYTTDDGKLLVEISRCDSNLSYKRSNMNIWVKAGFLPAALPSYLCVSTYYYADDGNCYGWYNCQTMLSGDGKRMVIDFAYLLEATPENEQFLVAQCVQMMERDERVKGRLEQ
jgi:hypothetical protein